MADEQVPLTVESLSGFPEGTVLEDGTKIVGDYDPDTNEVIGWHKELV